MLTGLYILPVVCLETSMSAAQSRVVLKGVCTSHKSFAVVVVDVVLFCVLLLLMLFCFVICFVIVVCLCFVVVVVIFVTCLFAVVVVVVFVTCLFAVVVVVVAFVTCLFAVVVVAFVTCLFAVVVVVEFCELFCGILICLFVCCCCLGGGGGCFPRKYGGIIACCYEKVRYVLSLILYISNNSCRDFEMQFEVFLCCDACTVSHIKKAEPRLVLR